MAITINGSGTIGGVSVGGLPDGIVDTDMLASAAVTSAKVGSLGTSNLPAGSVIQVVQATAAPTGGTSSTSTSFIDSNIIEIAITPIETSSKILVYFSGFLMHPNPAANNWGGALHIYRSVAGGSYSPVNGDSTRGLTGTYKHNQYSDSWDDRVAVMQYLDTPTYTSGQQLKYRVYFKASTRNTGIFHIQHTGGMGSYSGNNTIVGIAQEIAG